MRSCLFVNADPGIRAIFMEAMGDVAPDAVFYMANDGTEALKIMAEDNIVPDYVFAELDMPGVDGFELLHQMRNVHVLKHVPVIIHASRPSSYHVEILKQMGAHAIYQKPFEYLGMCNILSLFFLQVDAKSVLN